jgi:hypothetical protein
MEDVLEELLLFDSGSIIKHSTAEREREKLESTHRFISDEKQQVCHSTVVYIERVEANLNNELFDGFWNHHVHRATCQLQIHWGISSARIES